MSALTDRDTNVAAAAKSDETQIAVGEENKPQAGQQQHRSVLDQKAPKMNGQSTDYVSPSDVLSPASQKLVGFKQRQINKQGQKNPAARTLFARTASGTSSGFDDVDASEKKP